MHRRVVTTVLFLTMGPTSPCWAQNVGKLAGRVSEAATGLPLPGATVVVEGTTLGAATDPQGEYFVLAIPVGTYSIRASFVGFEPKVYENVEINQDFTRELSFSLDDDVAALEEIVVQYERPLLQRDAIGVPRVVTGSQIENLPVRGIAQVAAIQGGVVAREGRDELHVRGGRDEEVIYFIDGIKVIGSNGVPQQAILEQEMLIGSLPAKYGDAMSGIISITTKGGSPEMFGTLEAITSEGLDDYGYDLASLSLGGPLYGDRLSFFVAGEFTHMDDRLPSAIDVPRLRADRIAFLRQNPQSLRFLDTLGNKVYLPMSGDILPSVDSDDDGVPDAVPFDEMLAAMNIPEGYVLDSPAPINGAEVEPLSSYFFEGSRPNFGRDRYTVSGNVAYSATDAIRVRMTGRYDAIDQTSANTQNLVLNYDRLPVQEQRTFGVGATLTHRVSDATFYQLRADWSKYRYIEHDPAFSSEVNDILYYGDIDHPANVVAARQMTWREDEALYVPKYQDGSLPGDGGIFGRLTDVGVTDPLYRKDADQQVRLSVAATTQFGLHQLEFGGEYERRTTRLFRVNTFGVSRFFHDGEVEAGAENAVDSYAQLSYSSFGRLYWGYDYLGIDRADTGDLTTFVNGALGPCDLPSDEPDSACDIPPYEPMLWAGYAQDKIEYKDLVLNLGVRLEGFDNNALVLRDPYAIVPILRATSIPDRPKNIDPFWAVYLDTGDNIIGYRDLDGNFYDAKGQETTVSEISRGGGTPRRPEGQRAVPTSEVFEDYDPEVIWMPRVGVSFAVTDQALFFAHYDKTSQRPTDASFASSNDYFLVSQGRTFDLDNANLRPQTTTEYEVGFRQRLGSRSALMISGFYKKIDDLIQTNNVDDAFPYPYTTYLNSDFGTVKGLQFEFDLRRTGGVALNANYTLQFAKGTGSQSRHSFRSLFFRPPDFIFPLTFDRRHAININLDYRLGEGDGPTLAGTHVLENFGFNVLSRFYSGFPYTPEEWPTRTASGRLNGERMPWSSRIDLRVDRRISLSENLSLTAFLWVQNLLDADNVLAVYSTTGSPSDNGYLESDEGKDYLTLQELSVCGPGCDGEISELVEAIYNFSTNSPWNYGIPRLTRFGLRVSF